MMRSLKGCTGPRTLALALAAVLGFCFGPEARASLILDISSVPGSNVKFTGSGTGASFTFNNNGSGHGFTVTSSSGAGDSVGLFGTLGGTYSYTKASITTISTGPPLVQMAPVLTSGGLLTITDASLHSLSGTIVGLNLTTTGSTGGVNANGSINLTGVSYTGTNTDLTQLKNEASTGGGVVTLSFQFTSSKSLTDFTANHAVNKTSYSGSIASVPEPSSLALGCMGALGVIGCVLRRRKALDA
jgi:hypothetical protein